MAITGTNFWTEFLTILEGGTLTSKPSYYLPQGGEGIDGNFAQSGEWANVIEQVFARTAADSPERARLVDLLAAADFWAPTDDLDFWKTQEINSLDVQDLAAAAETRFPVMFGINDEPALIGGVPNPEVDVGGGVTVAPGAQPEEGVAEEGVGGAGGDPDTRLTILTSKEMKWYFDRASGKWYVEYGLPNSDRNLVFEAEPDQLDALFGSGMRPTDFEFTSLRELTQREGSTFAGNIAEMEGTGTFESEVDRVITFALDEGRLPEWAAKDGIALDIIYTAQSEGKSTQWVIEQLSKTQGFKERFPQIATFQSDNNLTLIEAISGFLEMEAGVNQALKATGQDGSADPAMIGSLLAAGHSLKTIQDTVSGFMRMELFAPALDAFNQILTQQGFSPITEIQDMLDFVTGRSSSAIYDLYEASAIQEAAVGAGLGDVFSAQDAIDLAYATNQTLGTATQGMQKAAELLLRLRHEVNVGMFGLDHEELIDISLGQTPRSGRSQADILESVNRAVLSAQGTLAKKVQPFTAFGESGTPQAASLRSLRQQS